MKKILITGGPTNEYIDEVMKITNMSSGRVAIEMSELFAKSGYDTTLLLTKGIRREVLSQLATLPNFRIIRFETTDELFAEIQKLSGEEFDVIIHSAAVADYTPEFSFRAEDMAKEISEYVLSHAFEINEAFVEGLDVEKAILDILTNPKCKVNDSTKISSVEPNLTVKLGLTPKIIASLRDLFPTAYICGFKLLENVSEDELVTAAMKQIEKCNTNLVFANDLAQLRSGSNARMVVTRNGYNGVTVDGAFGIFNLIRIVTEL